jgi:hypothetical protein
MENACGSSLYPQRGGSLVQSSTRGRQTRVDTKERSETTTADP